MLLTLEEVKLIDESLTTDDIRALEMAIITYANNHFHRKNYNPNVGLVEGKRIFFDDVNLFHVGDSVELVGVPYIEGFYDVEAVGNGFIEINTLTLLPAELEISGGNLYQLVFPLDVKAGALNVLKYKHKVGSKRGIKSESISRYSVTYADSSVGSVMGVPSAEFDFLLPYMKMR